MYTCWRRILVTLLVLHYSAGLQQKAPRRQPQSSPHGTNAATADTDAPRRCAHHSSMVLPRLHQVPLRSVWSLCCRRDASAEATADMVSRGGCFVCRVSLGAGLPQHVPSRMPDAIAVQRLTGALHGTKLIRSGTAGASQRAIKFRGEPEKSKRNGRRAGQRDNKAS